MALLSKHVVTATGVISSTVTSESFETSLGAWTIAAATSFTRTFYGVNARTGTYAAVAITNSGPKIAATSVVTGLTVGAGYTLSGWTKAGNVGTHTAKVGVTGLGTGTATTNTGGGWLNATYSFIATATSHTLELWGATAGTDSIAWDDISLTQTSVALNVIDSEITLDDSWNPYVQGTLNCSMPSDSDLALIDPRNNVRVSVVLSQEFNSWNSFGFRPTETRTFDLYLVTREADFNAGTLRLELRSDESRLVTWGLASSTPERSYGLSVKDACNYALGKIGASVVAGGDDANLVSKDLETVKTNLVTNPGMETAGTATTVTNLILNPSVETNLTGWQTSNTLTQDSTQSQSGTKSAKVVMTTTGVNNGVNIDYIAATVGTTYTFSFYARAAATTPTMSAELRWFTSANAAISSSTGTIAAVTTSGWTRYTVSGLAPATTAKVWPIMRFNSSTSTGDAFYLDSLIMTSGATVEPYFDGSTTAATIYNYAWTGTAHASTSTRTKYIPSGYAVLNSTIARCLTDAAAPHSGTYQTRVDLVAGAAGTTGVSLAYTVGSGGIVASTVHSWSAWVYSPTGSADVRLRVAGAGVAATVTGSGTSVKNAWVRLDVVFTTAASGAFSVFVENAGTATATSIYVDDAQITATPAVIGWFNGSSTGSNDAGLYAVAWTGTANASTSTLTNLANTDATIWNPGVNAWDWLAPLLSATNLRLWCDEARVWHLDVAGKTVDAVVSINQSSNVTQAKDAISSISTEGGQPVSFNGVVVKYSWTDSAGLSQTAYDVAGTGNGVVQVEYRNTIYPGPGAAAYILARSAGRGRVFALEAMSSYLATPGMTLVADLPSTPLQTGYVSAVTWSLPSARMTVKSRGLINTPAHAWVLGTVGQSWTSGAAGQTWATAP